ncbi:hypothetical protein [Delftia phage PhiW-14]|uniref:Uncharacterized protein n=1 Tax=Delftia phage PhiW-14 TaxID=665032 RepID=C9DG01_BPW14|nr:hypothetical protein DP-phiW-14_gp029 [Delftia phage PhiW-14]ACV50052.1 hypothetical protein [Delftia phage PhiW-14]
MVESNLLERMQQTHVLQQRFRFNITELYALPPWEYHVRVDMILIDQQEERDRAVARGNK